jgi:predicted transcriptional regulator
MTKRRKSRPSAPDAPRLHDTVRLSADGLARVLGDLEARVLQAVWDTGRPVLAHAVHELVAETHPVSPLTVITVLNKLVAKGVLARKKQHDLLHFSATMSEEESRLHASRRVVEGILSFGPDAVATFPVTPARGHSRLAVRS